MMKLPAESISLVILFLLVPTNAEHQVLTFSKQQDEVMLLSTFGYLKGGQFSMNVSLTFKGQNKYLEKEIGFRFDKSLSGGRENYMYPYNKCPLDIVEDKDRSKEENDSPQAILKFSYSNETKSVVLRMFQHRFSGLRFFPDSASYVEPRFNDNVYFHIPANSTNATKAKAAVMMTKEKMGFIDVGSLPAHMTTEKDKWTVATAMYFRVDNDDQAGLYELYIHTCDDSLYISNGKMEIIEENIGSFLSAGEIALPMMYGAMAVVMFIASFLWGSVLWSKRSQVFAIHYLMATFVFVKALSITFHSIDYYFISRDGKQEAWAVIFYIVHLLKGILLFLCLLLIGTGWAFIKYVLSDREKKLFMIVIPLQVIANVAYMMRGEEQGILMYNALTWTYIMFFIDVICFGVILVSITWSTRHLQEASTTDGKAALNVSKLKLFQLFYILVIGYLYFRRVVVYFLRVTLPFHYTWIHHFLYEVVSLTFFVVVGYKFRPGCDNPYLYVPLEDEDDVETQVLTETGHSGEIRKVNQRKRDLNESDEEEEVLLLQRNKTTIV